MDAPAGAAPSPRPALPPGRRLAVCLAFAVLTFLSVTMSASSGASGKVTGAVDRGGARLTRIHLTSVDAGNRVLLERVLVAAAASAEPGVVSNTAEEPR